MNEGPLLLATALLLVVIGLYTVVSKRNLLKIVIGIEIIATGVNLNFVAVSLIRSPGFVDPVAHAFAILSIVLDGALVGVALAIVVVVFRRFGTIDADKIRKLRW